MKALITVVSVSFLFLFSSSVYAGGGGQGHQINWWTMIWSFVNFFVLLGLLIFFLRKPMKDYLTNRRHTIKESLDEAARLREEAKVRSEESAQRMDRVEQEMSEMLEKFRQDGEKEKARILESAKEQAKKIKEEGTFQIQQELKLAKQKLRKQAVETAVEIARNLIVENMSEEDRRRLAEEYIDNFQSVLEQEDGN